MIGIANNSIDFLQSDKLKKRRSKVLCIDIINDTKKQLIRVYKRFSRENTIHSS